MAYAGERRILDADSHLMELPGFLDEHMEPEMRDGRAGRDMAGSGSPPDEAADRARARRDAPAKAAKAEERLLIDKGWLAMGAFDRDERSRVLDLLGFEGQLVFPTFAA